MRRLCEISSEIPVIAIAFLGHSTSISDVTFTFFQQNYSYGLTC